MMMKTFLSALILTSAASAAQAEIKLETRAYHSNLRVDADSAFIYLDGVPEGTTSVSEAFFNTAGGGVAAVFRADESIEFGLGYNLARYYPNEYSNLTQQEITAFSRWNVLQPGAVKLYVLAGISSQELNSKTTDNTFGSAKVSYTPVANYDFGLGSSYRLGSLDLGLEYKYSNTLGTGSATFVNKVKGFNGVAPTPSEVKGKFQDVKIEGQELALTVGMKL